MMNEFFSWNILATFTGCAAATAIITEFVKTLPFLEKVATQWVSYVIAIILLLGASFFTGTLTPASGALIPLDAVVVALSANGAYSAMKRAAAGKTP